MEKSCVNGVASSHARRDEDGLVEPLVHFVVPFAALSIADVRLKRAFLVSLLALTPDLDVLFLVHRSVSHSLLVMLAVAGPFLLLSYRFRLRYYGLAWLGFAAGVSHLILDVFGGYTPILWPVYGYSVWVQAGLLVHVGSSASFMPSFGLLLRPTFFQQLQGLDGPLFTGEGLILSLLLLLPVLVKAARLNWRRLRDLKGLIRF